MNIGVLSAPFALALLWAGSTACADPPAPAPTVYPGAAWETRAPAEVGLARERLEALAQLAGGRGCVVRHGCLAFTWGDQQKSSDVASAFKPVLTTLLFMAIQEGRLKGVDDKVAGFEPRLRTLNGGKDAGITWRHFASQTSGYGLEEAPGAAYSYNDFALALYYDTLTQKVFGTNGTAILKTHLAEPLQFQDRHTFNAFGRDNRPGRLALSVRDFARFGLLYLRHGRWRERQLIQPEFIDLAIHSPLPANTPLTRGREADMLPQQRSIGGTRNITPVGPGFYSFNWWTNGTDKNGHRLWAALPSDTYVAAGHGGMRMLWILPSFDLIVVWNDAQIEDQDASPENPHTKCNQAARLIRDAVLDAPTDKPRTELGVRGPRFTSIADLAALRAAVRRLDPDRLVTASHGGDLTRDELRDYLQTVHMDFIAPHRPREAGSAGQTETQTRRYLAWMSELARAVPVHYQEPFRRDGTSRPYRAHDASSATLYRRAARPYLPPSCSIQTRPG